MIPLTSASTQVDDLNRFLTSARYYAVGNELWFLKAERQAKKLLKTDPVSGHNVLGLLYSVTGDVERANYYIDCTLKLSDAAMFALNKATILSNLGFFSEATKWFKKGASPELGEFTSRWRIGLMGSFRSLDQHLSVAEKLRLDNLDQIDGKLIRRIVSFLDQQSIADETVAAMLDVAGAMLRENRIFFVGPGPEVSVWDQDALEQHLAITLRVPLSSAETLALDEELGHRLFAEVPRLPFVVILNFESGLPSSERFSERPAVAG